MRICCVSATLFLALVLTPLRLPAQPTTGTRTETPLAEVAPLSADHASIHELLLAQQFARARGKANSLLLSLAETDDAGAARTAVALAFLALAEAGGGDPILATCHWHAAQSLDTNLKHVSLAAYGKAGALLEAGNPQELKRAGDKGVTRPEKISGPSPIYTTRARKAHITGDLIVEGIIREDGRVTHLRVLRGLPMGLDLMALLAVCDWRFKPAMYDGKPAAVYYTLVVTFAVR